MTFVNPATDEMKWSFELHSRCVKIPGLFGCPSQLSIPEQGLRQYLISLPCVMLSVETRFLDKHAAAVIML